MRDVCVRPLYLPRKFPLFAHVIPTPLHSSKIHWGAQYDPANHLCGRLSRSDYRTFPSSVWPDNENATPLVADLVWTLGRAVPSGLRVLNVERFFTLTCADPSLRRRRSRPGSVACARGDILSRCSRSRHRDAVENALPYSGHESPGLVQGQVSPSQKLPSIYLLGLGEMTIRVNGAGDPYLHLFLASSRESLSNTHFS